VVSSDKNKDSNQLADEKSENGTAGQKPTVEFPPALSVRELSELLKVSTVDIIKRLIRTGIMANINQVIDFKTASAVAADLGFEAHLSRHVRVKVTVLVKPTTVVSENRPNNRFTARPPVITIMGHVDPRQNKITGRYQEE